MRFAELAETLEKLEGNARRTESRDLLAALFRRAKPPQLSRVVYFVQGLLRPEYEGIELGVAASLASKAIAQITHQAAPEVARRARAVGDLGTTAEELLAGVRRLEPGEALGVDDVYLGMRAIADVRGDGAQEKKVQLLADLLRRAAPREARYLIRFVIGTLRVGVREMTILDALASAFGPGDPTARGRVEEAFNLTSDLGMLAELLSGEGPGALGKVRLLCGRPIRPMLAERAATVEEIVERMGETFVVEYKYDGLRVQAHVPRSGPVRLFSRRLEEIGQQFPELLEAIPRAVTRRPAILEGECVPIDPKTGAIVPFQQISRRRGRKYELERLQSEVPVVFFAFDLLLAQDREIYRQPFGERRKALEELLEVSAQTRLAEQRTVHSAEEARDFFEEVLSEGAEGMIAKSLAPASAYRAGARGFWWIKFKRDYQKELADSIDGVIVGGFHGRGRRAGRFGAYLLAVYDKASGRFPTFCKVGSGLDDALLERLPKLLQSAATPDRPEAVDSLLVPDQWFRPQLVVEVRGAELTLSPIHRAAMGVDGPNVGLALRFPRSTGRLRDDKGPTDATTTDELRRLYDQQRRMRGGRRTSGRRASS